MSKPAIPPLSGHSELKQSAYSVHSTAHAAQDYRERFPTLVLTLSQINPVPTFTHYFNIHFNGMFTSA
jgi:hypothetical protein